MSKVKYDFAGWVTKNDILCSDGVTIKHDAFKTNDGKRVPLVWNHDYKTPTNVLGYVELKNHPNGVYGYGHLNDTEEARNTKELIRHGDIASMSIGARKIKRNGSNVVHGQIYEVSLVLAGANPGALIDTVVNHSGEDDTESGIIYTGTLIHSEDDILDLDEDFENEEDVNLDEFDLDEGQQEEFKSKVEEIVEYVDEEDEPITHAEGDSEMEKDEQTIGEVIDTLTEEQQEAVYALIGSIVESYEEEEAEEDENEKGDDNMKQNVFSKDGDRKNDQLRHSVTEVLYNAMDSGSSSLKQALDISLEDTLEHGINSIEMLFPDAMHKTNGNEPILYKDPNTSYKIVLDNVTKTPFSRVRTLVADLTEEEARAKGYIKGSMKKEQFFSLIKRVTTPTTVYKKQKIDRDDLVDITDFNVVAFMNREMRMMLEEEIARAILVGDGRDISSDDKINEQNIRPVIKDHEFFTIHKAFTEASDFAEVLIMTMPEYRGSGAPIMFIDPVLLAEIKLLKGTDGKYIYGDIPTTDAVANRFGVDKIVPTTFMSGKGALILNLRDYSLGATNGGQITNFDDFDIDFNQYKYLIETRLSGALTMPKSAIHLAKTTAGTSADDTVAGLTYGERQSDKVEPDPEP